MRCPVDATPLELVTRDGVEIDYCPECRGVWLDRGELQRLLIRVGASPVSPSPLCWSTHVRAAGATGSATDF